MSRKTWGVKGEGPVLPGNWGSRYTIPKPHEMNKGKPNVKTNCKFCIHNDQEKCKSKYKEEVKAEKCPQYIRSDLYPSFMEILKEEEQIETNKVELNNPDMKSDAMKSKNNSKKKRNVKITFSEYIKEKLDFQMNLLREASIEQKEVSKKLFSDRQKYEKLLERFVLLCLFKKINPSSVLIRSYIFNYLSSFLLMGEDGYREKYSNIQSRLNFSKEKLDVIKGGLELIQADWDDLNVEKFYNSNYLNAKEEILKPIIRSLDDYEYEELITSEKWKSNEPLLRERALAQWTGEMQYYGALFGLDDWEYLYDFIEEFSENSKFPFIEKIMKRADHDFDTRKFRRIISPETLKAVLYIDKYGEVNAQVEIILDFYGCAIGDMETTYGAAPTGYIIISETYKKGTIFDILWERYLESINITDTQIILKKLAGSQKDNEIYSNEFESEHPIGYQEFFNQCQIRIGKEIDRLKMYSNAEKIEAMMIYKDKRDGDILSRFILLCLEKFKDYGVILNCLEYYNQLELYVSYGDSLYLSIFSKYIDNVYDSDYLLGIVDVGIKMIGCTWDDILFINQYEEKRNQLSQEVADSNLFSLRKSQILFNIIFHMMEMTQVITILDKDPPISLNDDYIEVAHLSMPSNDLLANPESLEIVDQLKGIKNQITARLCIEPLTNELFIDFTAKVKCIFPSNMNQNDDREDVIVLQEKITQNQYLEKEWENFLRLLKEKVRNQEDRECLI